MSIYLLAASFFSLSIFLISFTILLIKLSKRRPAGAIKFILPIFLVLTILCGVGSFVTLCKHQWIDATCSAPKTCALCGITEGMPLEHQWQDATCSMPKTCELCGKTEGEPLEHTWVEATCTTPKTCSACGETEGDALGHDWIEATCITPKTCSRCGVTEGSTAEHQWVPATKESPKTCSVCGKTSGSPLAQYSETTQAVLTGYESAIEYTKEKGYDADYAYKDVRKRLVELNSAAYLGDTTEAQPCAWGLFDGDWENLSIDELQEKAQYVLEYVTADDDHLSALMRKFSSMNSVSGTITPTSVDISVDNMAEFVAEMGLRAEVVGGVLAVIKNYDYSWIDPDSSELLQFTDNGFTFHWEAVGQYTLQLSD